MSAQSKFLLFKRSNGLYYILFNQDGRRRWKSTGCGLKTDALKKLSQFQEFLNSKPEEVSLSEFVGTFLPFATANYSKCTVEFYMHSLERLKLLTNNCSLLSLTMQHLDQYKIARMQDRPSPATLNRELQALRAAMNTAMRWKLIDRNPFAKIQFIQVPDVLPPYFSKEDFQRLLKRITEDWLKEIILFGTLTGMRRGEMLNLRWQDIDLNKRLVFIQSNPTFKTKQGKRRVVPMNDAIYSLICRKKQQLQNEEYIFTKHGRKINDDHVSKKLKKYVADTFGKECKLHFHSLRHTFASWLVQDGVSLYEVQKLLGHSNIAVTQVYSHLQPEQLHSTVNKISLTMN